MLEINFEHPSFKNMRFCRRIVLKEGVDVESIDPNWRRKLERGGVGSRHDIILRKASTQVPKGFEVVASFQNGQSMGIHTSPITHKRSDMIHVCDKHERQGEVEGLGYKLVPLDETTQ